MARPRRVTREIIVEEARRLVGEEGTGALTFQALASALGVSKQAIIYWYPSKRELVRDFCLPALRQERDALVAATAGAMSAADAIERHVRALVAHHGSDLGRFRMVYLWVQFEPDIAVSGPADRALLDPVHATTSSAYDALEAKIAADSAFLGNGNARRLAVAVDMAAIGLITLVAMAEAMNDPWVHSIESMVDSLVALLTGRHSSEATSDGGSLGVHNPSGAAPMADILSLSKARKTKARADKEETAAGNRAKFGRTKAAKLKNAAEIARSTKAAEAHKRDK